MAKVESVDVGGSYSVTIKKSEKTGSFPGSSTQNDLLYSGSIDSEEFNLDDLDFSKFKADITNLY